MKLKNVFFALPFWIFILPTAKAQTINDFSAGVSYLSGTNINRSADKEFGNSRPGGLEIFYQRKKTGKKYWEKQYNYPTTGWSLTWIDQRNNNLGHAFVLNRYLNIPFWRKKQFEVYLRIAQGILFTNSIYKTGSIGDPFYNNAISQKLNFSEQIGLGLALFPSKHTLINIAANVNHFSNGALSQPNDGLNIATLNIAFAYTNLSKNSIPVENTLEKPKENNKVGFNINVGGGYKQLIPENENKYPLLTISSYIDKKISPINALNLGADFFLNYGVKHSIANNQKYVGTDFKRVGLVVGHELFINKIGLLTQGGFHVYSPYPALSNFYQKVGIKYYVTENLFIGFTLRSYRVSISDEIAWGIGMRL